MKKLPSTKHGRKQLLKLADLLDENAKNKKGMVWNFMTFGSVKFNHQPELSCNTEGCAMGLAAVSGEFPHLGVKIGSPDHVDSHSLNITWKKKDIDPFIAAIKTFEVTYKEAEFLFADASAGAKDEREMAKLLRNFVAGKDVVPRDYLR